MKEFIFKIWRFLWKILFIFFCFSLLLVVLYRFVPVPFTWLMLQRCVEQKMNGKSMHLEKKWIPVENISPAIVQAVVASEDNNFMSHWGFDFEAIEKALKRNETAKKKIGASTISQQTAKNVFLWPGRSWIRKGFEVYFTLAIELVWSKKRIMEVYLNVIEMGDGIYGVHAAAGKYFGKTASGLTQSESALIAAILPSPRKWSPVRPGSFLLKRQNFILRNMNNIGPVDLK